jgi:uncharacterized membrane protein YgaE (UPF0421/DUF939 family)
MEAILTGPLILGVLISIYLVKRKRWGIGQILWGMVLGLLVASMFTSLPGTVSEASYAVWNWLMTLVDAILAAIT